MAKIRAQRRAERLVVEQKQKAIRARQVARRQRRRALLRQLTPPTTRRSSSGRLHRRSRTERAGIVGVPLLAIAAIWLLIPDPPLRVVLTAMIVIAVPALVVVVLGRRS